MIDYVRDPKTRVLTRATACKVCGLPIYFGITEAGKRCPYDIEDGVPSRVSHFITCKNVRQWTAAHPKAP